ncbi:MAG TPA: GNAT family N-acetyltransferase [Actinomycetota bacterium]
MTAPRTPDAGAVSGLAVRPATAADLDAVARIWHEGWADGHAGHVPAALVAERTPGSFGPRALERVDRTWVAERGGVVAGFVAVVAGNTRARRFYARMGWRDRGPFTYQAQTATGTFPVPTHRYEREVGRSSS